MLNKIVVSQNISYFAGMTIKFDEPEQFKKAKKALATFQGLSVEQQKHIKTIQKDNRKTFQVSKSAYNALHINAKLLSQYPERTFFHPIIAS